MYVFACLECLSRNSTSFWLKICEEKNFTIVRRFAIIEHESLHCCETLLYKIFPAVRSTEKHVSQSSGTFRLEMTV